MSRTTRLAAVLLTFPLGTLQAESKEPKPNDLVTPETEVGKPAAGKRVFQVAPEYRDTRVYHSLYLPVDWKEGERYPVIVELTGNRFPACGSTGEVKDANLGYGLTGGRGFLWVSMPYVDTLRGENAVTWWGDRDATVEYCKLNVPRICEQFGGDIHRVFLCGFSRGAIGVSYIGLADDEIEKLWRGFISHDHFDGQRQWGYVGDDRASALQRLGRLRGRPVLVCGTGNDFLREHLELADFTFLRPQINQIFSIPEGKVIHPHTDRWMHRASPERALARQWLSEHARLVSDSK
ncbi:MAG: hypothetical protein AAGJ83_11435 [Planctomycetota bacterium]